MIAVTAALLAAGCGADTSGQPDNDAGPHVPHEWLAIARHAYQEQGSPKGTIPHLELAADCAIPVEIELDGKTARGLGAGAAGVDGGGFRYLCNFMEPSSMFIVAKYDSAESYRDAQLDTSDQEVSTHKVDGVEIRVRNHLYPNGRAEQRVQLSDPKQHAILALTIETAPDLDKAWRPSDSAKLLADLTSQAS